MEKEFLKELKALLAKYNAAIYCMPYEDMGALPEIEIDVNGKTALKFEHLDCLDANSIPND